MSKKSNRHNRSSKNRGRGSPNPDRRRNAHTMTASEIGVIKDWFYRMRVNVKRGIDFAQQVPDQDNFNEDNPLFWATVKAIENFTESVKQLDDTNYKILTQLFEITEWKQIKGMRDVVAHQFWKLDADKIWNTAQNDLPQLHKLLSNLNIKDDPLDDLSEVPLSFSVNETYSPSQRQEISQAPKPGEFIIMAWFDSKRIPHARRIEEEFEYCTSCGEKSYRLVLLDRQPEHVGKSLPHTPLCNSCSGMKDIEVQLRCNACGATATWPISVGPRQPV